MKLCEKMGIAVLSTLILLSAGCASNTVDTKERASTASVGMGRYIEEECQLPEPLYVRRMHLKADGSLFMISQDIAKDWKVYISPDKGDTWKLENPAWISELENKTVDAVAFDEADICHIAYRDEANPQQTCILKIDSSGGTSTLIWPAMEREGGTPFAINDMEITQGKQILSASLPKLEQFDEQGALQNTYNNNGSSFFHAYITVGNLLYTLEGDMLNIYDIATGEQTDSLPVETDGKIDNSVSSIRAETLSDSLFFDQKSNSLFFCTASGIHRYSPDNNVLERVADGSMNSLNQPSMVPHTLLFADNTFLILYSRYGELSFMRYTYNPDMVTTPENEFSIFSLKDDKSVREAIGIFQRDHQDYRVDFDVALADGSAQTRSDAVRTLNTELLAGKGPDVLILDDLPLSSYIDKGVLMDVSPIVAPMVDDGTLMKNVSTAYLGEDNKIFAIPTRFSVPVLLGTTPALDAINNLTELAEWIAREGQTGKYDYTVYASSPEMLVRELFPVCAPTWVQDGGTLDVTAVGRFMEDCKKISDTMKEEDIEEYTPDMGGINFLSGCMYWQYDVLALNFGTLHMGLDLMEPTSAIQLRGEGRLVPLPGQTKGVYIPQAIVGVNANGANVEMASDFLNTMLSDEVQGFLFFGNGFPIANQALRACTKNPYSPDTYENGLIVYSDTSKAGIPMEQSLSWPPEEKTNELLDIFRQLDTPSPVDSVMLDVVAEGAQKYFSGEETLAQAVSALSEKIALMLSE